MRWLVLWLGLCTLTAHAQPWTYTEGAETNEGARAVYPEEPTKVRMPEAPPTHAPWVGVVTQLGGALALPLVLVASWFVTAPAFRMMALARTFGSVITAWPTVSWMREGLHGYEDMGRAEWAWLFILPTSSVLLTPLPMFANLLIDSLATDVAPRRLRAIWASFIATLATAPGLIVLLHVIEDSVQWALLVDLIGMAPIGFAASVAWSWFGGLRA